MDDEARQELDEAPDAVNESAYFVLAEADDVWGVWDRDRLREPPLVSYPFGDAGFKRASDAFKRMNQTELLRRGPWLSIALWLMILAGTTWVASEVIFVSEFTIRSSGGDLGSFRWWAAATEVAQPLFFVSFAAYLAIWLRLRNDVRVQR